MTQTTQNKIAVSLYPTVINGITYWNTAIYCPEKKEDFVDIFYTGKYFGIAQYYADYFQYLFGITKGEKPDPCDYDDKSLEAPENFDFSIYESIAENQPLVTLHLYPLPESNGKQNWTVTIESSQYEWFELLSYQSEFYDKSRLYYDNWKYILGNNSEAPNPDNYNMLLQKNAVTGEVFIK